MTLSEADQQRGLSFSCMLCHYGRLLEHHVVLFCTEEATQARGTDGC